jgi:hypothetical protein
MITNAARTCLVLFVAAGLFSGYAAAEHRIVSKMHGIEATTDGVLLPSGDTGRVLFKSCVACPQSSLEVGRQTEFFVGSDAVDFATLKRFVGSGGPYFMMLYHEPGQTVFSRIVVAARLGTRDASTQ